MSIDNSILWQLARLSDLFDLSSDTWFAIAAVMTLWVYMILAPGRDSSEL